MPIFPEYFQSLAVFGRANVFRANGLAAHLPSSVLQTDLITHHLDRLRFQGVSQSPKSPSTVAASVLLVGRQLGEAFSRRLVQNDGVIPEPASTSGGLENHSGSFSTERGDFTVLPNQGRYTDVPCPALFTRYIAK
jgi:hypothetical protein